MRKLLRPADPRLQVAKPEGGPLAVEGERVVMNVYWHRRLADGSVIEIRDEPAAPALTVPQPATRRPRSRK